MLSKEKLQTEIDATSAALKSMKDTIKKCEDGIIINEIVFAAFKAELAR